MTMPISLLLAIALGGPATRATPPPSTEPAADPGATPVLVELFTSEGCSSCPPADRLLTELAAGPSVPGARVVALGYHVTYWDRLGWRDRFSSQAWTERQESYARAFGLGSVYTPQAVVDGAAELVGSRSEPLVAAVERIARRPKPHLELEASLAGDRLRVRIGLPPSGFEPGAEAWLAVVEHGLATDVEAGENRSRRLRHAPVVRLRRSLGAIAPGSGPRTLGPADLELEPAWDRSRLEVVAVVQRAGPGPVLALATAPLPEP